MTGLFKCVVLSCAVSLAFGYMSVRDDANWFKNGDRIRNKFVTGVVNGIVDFDCNDTVNGENVEGECLSKVECTKSEGKLGGLCSLLGTCCVIEKTCSQTTSAKLSYFVPPKNFTTDCPLTINVYSKDVCQIRLDFLKFDIEQPTSQVESNVNASYQCHRDSFTVENVKNLGFVHLCGKNDGQHIYIPVRENQQNVKILFHFHERNQFHHSDEFISSLPNWRIKIRQLECQKLGYEHQLNAPSKLMAMYNSLKNKKHPKNDYEWIAPPHCLQYYPQKTGTFESFNYNNGMGPYIGQMHYAICFRKSSDICSARYALAGIFQMNYNKYRADEDIRDVRDKRDKKCRPLDPPSPDVSHDYIRIPGGIDSAGQHIDYYCNQMFDNRTVTAESNEPLYVGVHTDRYRANSNVDEEESADFEEIGFRLRYTLSTGNCDIRY